MDRSETVDAAFQAVWEEEEEEEEVGCDFVVFGCFNGFVMRKFVVC
jgi:hypothetical protein